MPSPPRHVERMSGVAVRFFGVATVCLSLATGMAWTLIHLLGGTRSHRSLIFPPAFAVSTVLLAAGSVLLGRAVRAVRREQQWRLRYALRAALVCGTLFMGTQAYGLWTLLPAQRQAADASLGTTAFVLALSTMHAIHVFVAILFLAFVWVRAEGDRYDHEYYWGVTVCMWFWHALGIAWLAVLAIFVIAI